MRSFERGVRGRWQPAVAVCLLVAGALIAAAAPQRRSSRAAAQGRDPGLIKQEESADRMSGKQQRKLLKHNFDKMKEDANELAALATSLQTDLDKTTENMLSLQIVEKAEKIEKLAKRIKSTARGF